MIIDDAGFVGAPAWLAYRRLTDLDAWPRWWPGLAVAHAPADGRSRHLEVMVPRRVGRHRLRVAVTPWGWRHDAGFRMHVAGAIVGELEWWLEDVTAGVLVHQVGRVDPGLDPAGPRWWRRALRRGLWGLGDALALEVRDAVALPRR